MKRKKEDEAKKKKKRTCICLIFWGLLAIVIACIVLAITLTRKGDNTPINTQWLNLTGFPPMPTGISTVIRPDVLNADNSCVSPSTLWSCAVPKEQASDIAPNDPDQPNFPLRDTLPQWHEWCQPCGHGSGEWDRHVKHEQ